MAHDGRLVLVGWLGGPWTEDARLRPSLIALDVDPGLIEDETKFKTRQGGYSSINNMRPHRGGLEVIGGWEFLTTEQLTGKCRGGHSWIDNGGQINFAFGTHSKLYVWTRGKLYDITPADFVAGNENGFGGGGYGVGTYGSGTYGAVSEGVFYPLTWTLDNYGEWLIANPRGGKVYVWKNDVAALAVELAGRTSSYDADFTGYADQTAFDADGWTRGTGWTFDAGNDEADCDGAQTGDSDLERTATGLTIGERYRVTVTFDSRSAGAISALGNTTEGTESSEASGTVAVVFIATATSHTVAARADADWVGSVTDLTVEKMGAPEIVESVLVTASRQIVAYGCEEELSVAQNPRCVRWCDIEDVTDWQTRTTNNAGEFVLRNAGRLVRAKEMGQLIGVWTDEGMFWQSFVGLPGQTWDFQRAGNNCGLVGPNGVSVLGTQAFWCGPDFVFYTASFGGEPLALPAPIDQTFKTAQVHAQQEKIYCSSISQFNEIWWFYPHEDDGSECSRYYAFSAREGKWFSGIMDRTTMIDSAPYDYPVAVDDDGYIYIHERGVTAAGNAISWHAETSDIYFNESGRVVQIRSMRPDLHDQQGAVKFTMKTKPYPQGDETTHTPQTIVASQDKADFRVSGAIVRLRWESDIVGATCRLGRPVFDVTQRGRR